jgi:hypothetical protein
MRRERAVEGVEAANRESLRGNLLRGMCGRRWVVGLERGVIFALRTEKCSEALACSMSGSSISFPGQMAVAKPGPLALPDVVEALKVGAQSASDRIAVIARLDRVGAISHNFGYGVGDDMDYLLVGYARE